MEKMDGTENLTTVDSTKDEIPVNDTELRLQQETEKARRRDRLIKAFGGVFVALMLGLGVVTYVYGEPGPETAFLGSGGGGCGMAGGTVGDVSDSGSGEALNDELKGLAMDKYKEETGKEGTEAKVTNFGCHLQVDILDESGGTVRSYGYQGGPLYVIS